MRREMETVALGSRQAIASGRDAKFDYTSSRRRSTLPLTNLPFLNRAIHSPCHTVETLSLPHQRPLEMPRSSQNL